MSSLPWPVSPDASRPVGLVDHAVEDPDEIGERDRELALSDGIAGREAGSALGLETVAPGVPEVDDVASGVEVEDGVKVAPGHAGWHGDVGSGGAGQEAAPGVGEEERAHEREETL